MTLKFTHSDLSRLLDALNTRISKVEDMIDHWEGKKQFETAEHYREEGQELQCLRQKLIVQKYKALKTNLL